MVWVPKDQGGWLGPVPAALLLSSTLRTDMGLGPRVQVREEGDLAAQHLDVLQRVLLLAGAAEGEHCRPPLQPRHLHLHSQEPVCNATRAQDFNDTRPPRLQSLTQAVAKNLDSLKRRR